MCFGRLDVTLIMLSVKLSVVSTSLLSYMLFSRILVLGTVSLGHTGGISNVLALVFPADSASSPPALCTGSPSKHMLLTGESIALSIVSVADAGFFCASSLVCDNLVTPPLDCGGFCPMVGSESMCGSS